MGCILAPKVVFRRLEGLVGLAAGESAAPWSPAEGVEAVYEQFFGLEDEPFRLTPDPTLPLSVREACRGPGPSSARVDGIERLRVHHRRRRHRQDDAPACLPRRAGAGDHRRLRLQPPLSALELLRRVCREFGLPVGDEGQSRATGPAPRVPRRPGHAGRTCVWCSTKRRRCRSRCSSRCGCCSNLETETRKLLRIVLVGQPQLRKLLLDPDLAQLNQRITLRWHLGPLSRRETMAYVHHRLAIASGGRAMRLFTRPALHLVHSVSGGVPRLINMVGHRALLAAFVGSRAPRHRRFVARAYREIQAVPLPGTLTLARRAALAGSGLAIGAALVAFGMPVYDRFVPPPAEVASAPGVCRSPPCPSRPRPSRRRHHRSRRARRCARTRSRCRLAGSRSGWSASTRERAPAPPPRPCWRHGTSARWPRGRRRLPDDLETVSWRRGLQALQLTANRSMLQLLDLPALLVVRLPGAPDAALGGPQRARRVPRHGDAWTARQSPSPPTRWRRSGRDRRMSCGGTSTGSAPACRRVRAVRRWRSSRGCCGGQGSSTSSRPAPSTPARRGRSSTFSAGIASTPTAWSVRSPASCCMAPRPTAAARPRDRIGAVVVSTVLEAVRERDGRGASGAPEPLAGSVHHLA